MKQIIRFVGKLIFYPLWPLLYLELRRSSRTRVLLVYNQEIIVVKGWIGDDKWSLPGGGLHRNEEPLRGAIREVAEELSIHLKVSQLVYLGDAKQSKKGLSYSYHMFVAELSKKPIIKRQAFELAEAVWMPASKLNMANAEQTTLTTLQAWSEVKNRARL